MGLLLTIAAFVVLGGGGLYFAVAGVGFLSTYLTLSRSDSVAASQLADQSGTVELTGTARTHERTDRSPFTDTETLVHEWRISENRGRGSDSIRWDEGTNPFLLEDDTGSVLVDPNGATLQMETTTEIEVGSDENPPATVADFLDSSERVSADSSRDRLYRESRLDPGDDVHVYGPVREAGHSADLPGGVDAVVGASGPVGSVAAPSDLSLSNLEDRERSDLERWFVVTNGDEGAAVKAVRGKGLFWVAIGATLMAIPVAMVVFA